MDCFCRNKALTSPSRCQWRVTHPVLRRQMCSWTEQEWFILDKDRNSRDSCQFLQINYLERETPYHFSRLLKCAGGLHGAPSSSAQEHTAWLQNTQLPARLILANKPRGVTERKSLCFIFKAEMECDDIHGKLQVEMYFLWGKKKSQSIVQLQLVFVITISYCKHGASDSPNDYVELEHAFVCDLIISLKENCVLIKKKIFFLSPQDAFSWSEVNSSWKFCWVETA